MLAAVRAGEAAVPEPATSQVSASADVPPAQVAWARALKGLDREWMPRERVRAEAGVPASVETICSRWQ